MDITVQFNLLYKPVSVKMNIKDAMPVSFQSELFTSYILTIFKQWNLHL